MIRPWNFGAPDSLGWPAAASVALYRVVSVCLDIMPTAGQTVAAELLLHDSEGVLKGAWWCDYWDVANGSETPLTFSTAETRAGSNAPPVPANASIPFDLYVLPGDVLHLFHNMVGTNQSLRMVIDAAPTSQLV